jgi:hypothetical protein
MKFGKRMRGLATPGWENDYVDYKLLKKTIRALTHRQQQQQMNGAIESAAMSTLVGRDEFVVAIKHELQRVNDAHDRIHDELLGQDLRALQNALGSRWVLSPSQARALLIGAIELSKKIDAFRRFILLNSLAIVKITKKFDKMFPGNEVKQVVLDDLLKVQPFYDGAAMDKLCHEASMLTDRVMLCILPDGNFRISDHKVSCPICLQNEVKSAITLSCKHTFCWSCLSMAAEHRFHSCPMCRKEQSIDPRDYAVDGLLMRFKRAYNFVEDALDRAPFASSPMRQILVEGFDHVNAHLRDIEAKYAALSPRPSLHDGFSEDKAQPTNTVASKSPTAITTTTEKVEPLVEATACTTIGSSIAPLAVFSKGDAVEVHYNGEWYPGMILHENDQDATSYSVLWWMHDRSQRFGQRMPRHLLREPVFPEQHPGQYLLFDFAAGAWRTATEWAWLPFRQLRSLSGSDATSLQGNSSAV